MDWTSATPSKDNVQDKQKLKWATSANENLNKQDIDKVERRIDDTLKHLQEHAQDKIKRYVAPKRREASYLLMSTQGYFTITFGT